MIKLIVLTGFLGAGKTTLLKRLIEEYSDTNVGVLINEFGAINVDAEFVKDEGIDMVELSNGSIFCACIKDKFVESLIQMSAKNIEYLFIEASGLADPASMPDILRGIEHLLIKPYQYIHSLCVVDATRFIELSEVLVALNKQVNYSDLVIVNKADLIDDEEFYEINNLIKEINPETFVVKASYCDVNIKELINRPSGIGEESDASTNTPESRPTTVVLKGIKPIDIESLESFLREVSKSTYRIKGFLEGQDGPLEVSCVGEQVEVRQWKSAIDSAKLVVISSVGIKIISVVCEAIEKHAKDKIGL